MATKRARLDANASLTSGDPTAQNAEPGKEMKAKLQAELDAERKLVKQLRREKQYEVQQARDQEQNKATVALKDLRAKLHQEKHRELEIQKEALNRKYDLDLQKVTKQKDAELQKMQGDLRKSQDELNQVTKRGLSGAARGAFEAERSKLLQEVKELRSGKRQLEDTLRTVSAADKQKAHELRRLQEGIKSDISKARKEADIEIRRLVS